MSINETSFILPLEILNIIFHYAFMDAVTPYITIQSAKQLAPFLLVSHSLRNEIIKSMDYKCHEEWGKDNNFLRNLKLFFESKKYLDEKDIEGQLNWCKNSINFITQDTQMLD